MLTGIRIYSSDAIWRQILSDFGAIICAEPTPGVINFDTLNISGIPSPLELKSVILDAADTGGVLRLVFHDDVSLSRIQAQIVVSLYDSGGMTMSELKSALGYAPDITTHSIDTAIYQLRKVYGRTFIKNLNGVYSLGEL